MENKEWLKKEWLKKEWLPGSIMMFTSYTLLITGILSINVLAFTIIGILFLVIGFYFHIKQDYELIKEVLEK